jgi:dihydrofolate synthase/folylpolyglutamate synthase
VLPGVPVQIVDVAHNPHGARALAQNLRAQPCGGRTLAVFAMLADKDIAAVVKALEGVVDAWYLAGLEVPRGADAQTLQAAVRAALPQAEVRVFATVIDARQKALADAAAADRVVVFGSFHTVAAVLAEDV